MEKVKEPPAPDVIEDRTLLLNCAQVMRYLCMSRRTVWWMVKAGKLPQPVRFSHKLVRWQWEDLKKWAAELK